MGEELHQKIERWIREEYVTEKQIEFEENEFHYLIHPPSNEDIKVEIFKPRNKDRTIVIGAMTKVSGEHQKRYLDLSDEGRLDFDWNLKQILSNPFCEFELIYENESIVNFVVSTEIFYDNFDEITKDLFFQRIKNIIKCKLRGIWHYQYKLGVVKK